MEEKPRTRFQQKCDKLSDRAWNTLQVIGGLLLGAAVVYGLFFSHSEEEGPVSFTFIIVMALALFLPREIERDCGRPILRGRIVMCVTLGVGIAVCALLMWRMPELFR